MSRTQIDALFDPARRRLGRVNAETEAFLVRTALTMLESDPGLAVRLSENRGRRTRVEDFLQNLRERPSDAMQRQDIKSQLHALCESPNGYVRYIALEIVGENRDEDALPILLPNLRASLREAGRHLPRGIGRARRVSPSDRSFLWSYADRGESRIWETVKEIGSPRTTEFLLEKLKSDDMAWVFTAAALLADMGEGRAIELLKKRYSELSESDEEGADLVLHAIAEAYQRLSGQPLPGHEYEVPRALPVGVPYRMER